MTGSRFVAAGLLLGLAAAGCAGDRTGGGDDRAAPGRDAAPGPVDFRDFEPPPIALSADGLPPVSASSEPTPDRYGFGRAAAAEEIAALDDDVRPDGEGLPEGSGTPGSGAAIYVAKCASCHGRTGLEGPENPLVSRGPVRGFPFAESPFYFPTVGTYWPYATTLFDYLRRAMPHDAPGTLNPTEVYSLVAWILWREGILPEDATLDADTLPRVTMPARGRFVVDDREGGGEIR